MKRFHAVVVLLVLLCSIVGASAGSSGMVVTGVQVQPAVGTDERTAEITLNNALVIREIRVATVGGRVLLTFPESVSKRGKVFPQVRLITPAAKEALYGAVRDQSPSSQWGPLPFTVAKVMRYGKKSSLKAFARVVFGGGVEVECRVLTGSRGLWVGWPARKQGAVWIDQVSITDAKLKKDVEAAVLAAYCK